jgi:hypothetical protein
MAMSCCNKHIQGAGFSSCPVPRRTFIKQIVAGGAALAGHSLLRSSARAVTVPAEKVLPTVKLGDHEISRLVAGYNPIGGYSHSTKKLSEHMLNHFTLERTAEFALHCEEEGITAWQADPTPKVLGALRAARERGSKIKWICLTSSDVTKEILDLKPIAVVHHGGVTDSKFQAGRQEEVHDFVKKVHDAGVLAGVSSHNPDFVGRIADGDWENDFFMTCFYNISRTPEEIKKIASEPVVGEFFLEGDPQRMTDRVREIKKPCLGFKILAAGRLCWNRFSIERAFAFAYSKIKPTDAVIVGMYPVFADEVKEDADFARKYAQPK